MKRSMKQFLLVMLASIMFLTALPVNEVKAELPLLTARIKECPKTCKVGDTLEIKYTTGGLGNGNDDGVVGYLRIYAAANSDERDRRILLHTETITKNSEGTFSYKVGDEAGQYLSVDMILMDLFDQTCLGGGNKVYTVKVTDGTALPVFGKMNLGRSGWVEQDGKKYYGDKDGKAVTGGQEIDGKEYFFDGAGVLQTGWYLGDDVRWHYSDEQGVSLSQNMFGLKSLTIPSYVDVLSINELAGVSKDFYIICEPGSYAEKFAYRYCLQYDTGKKKVIGSSITSVDEKVKWIVANYITPGMSDNEKIHRLCTWLQSNSSYDDTYTYYHANGVLIVGRGVCESYAEAFDLLLKEAGIESKVQTGLPVYNPSSGHAWTLVRCDGQWYHTDPVGCSSSGRGSVVEYGEDLLGCALLTDKRCASVYTWNEEVQVDRNKVGWVQTKDAKYYYDGRAENGGRATGTCTINGVEYVFDDDGTFLGSANDPTLNLRKIKAFVSRCYQLILNRAADEGGLKGWSEALKSKTAAAANIIDGFVKSDEFKNRNLSNDAKVDILYKTMLNREADADGKAGWVDALSKGYTLQNIIDGFCGSPEFKAICDSYGIEPGSVGAATPADTSTPRGKIEAFVKRCYSLILSRDADEGGLKGWSDALETRTAAAAQIIDGFVRSEEYTNRKLSAGESVDILYKTMLDRNADEGGRAGWVDALGQGYTLQHIINGFCGSAEFTAICDSYGIVAGSVAVSGAVVKREAITPEGEEEEAAPVIVGEYRSEFINEEKIKAFVEHCYKAVFGREGDAEGIGNYTRAILDGKKSPRKLAYEFIFSPEFQNNMPGNEEFIQILYRLYFDREPGAEELAGWVTMLEDGASLEEIVNGFAGSAEFKAIVNRMKE